MALNGVMELNQSQPPTSSDDLCLPFCLILILWPSMTDSRRFDSTIQYYYCVFLTLSPLILIVAISISIVPTTPEVREEIKII